LFPLAPVCTITPVSPTLTFLIPIYNESATVEEIVSRVQASGLADEIVLVDDGSTDGTDELLRAIQANQPQIKLISHPTNQGKGAAIRSGIAQVTSDLVLIQDADLEYDPREVSRLLEPILEDRADVVYGSRFLGGPRRTTMFWHMVANKMLTLMTNVMYNSILSDMETGYKLFKREWLEQIQIRSDRFDFEPEITAKLLKRRARIFEVPISFNPREYADGKKIGLIDAFAAVWALLKYRLVD